MNILMFCSNQVNGGTARVFYELSTTLKGMLEDTDRLIICVNKNNPVEIYKKIDGIVRLPVYSETEICFGMYGGNLLRRIVNRLRRRIKCRGVKRHNIEVMKDYLGRNQIDAVVIHNGGYVGDDLCNQLLEASYYCAEHTQCRIYVMHSDMKKNMWSKLAFWTYDKKISKEATELVTVSCFTRDRIIDSSFINREIKVINNGIANIHTFAMEEKQKIISVDPQKINILMIGNFQDNKGQHKFLEAAGELYKVNRKSHFTIIGNVYSEDYYKKCNNLIENLGLRQQVSIYQEIHNASEFIDMFDILVVPSMRDESFGLISVEAMANQRPVVAFACGGIPEVVLDGRDGFVVPVGNTTLLVEKIQWLVMHPEERKRMGKQGREDYEHRFSVEVMAKSYLELIKSTR